MALRIEKNVQWSSPTKRVVFGLILLAAGVGTLALGWGSALSWVEIGLAMIFLGTAFAHSQGGIPRWKVAAMEATEDGITLHEVRAKNPDIERQSKIPARLIRRVEVADLSGIANQIQIVTSFGRLPWSDASKDETDLHELKALRQLWNDVTYDPEDAPWVEGYDPSAFAAADGEIRWRQPANFQPIGHLVAVAGPAVAAVPLFGKAWGIPFALIAGLSLVLFLNSARHLYRLVGYRCRLSVEDGELRYRRPMKRRSVPIDEIERIQVNTLGLDIPWTIEVNGGGMQELLADGGGSLYGALKALFKGAYRLLKSGWLIQLQDHGAPETIALVKEMHELTGASYQGTPVDIAGTIEMPAESENEDLEEGSETPEPTDANQ